MSSFLVRFKKALCPYTCHVLRVVYMFNFLVCLKKIRSYMTHVLGIVYMTGFLSKVERVQLELNKTRHD